MRFQKEKCQRMNSLGQKKSTISAVGIVIPVEWDGNGYPVAFAISTYDEQEYLIDATSDAGRELIRMQHKKVRVRGHLRGGKHNRSILSVEGFERI